MQILKKRNSIEPLITNKGHGIVNYDGLVEDETQRHRGARRTVIFDNNNLTTDEYINPYNFPAPTKSCTKVGEPNYYEYLYISDQKAPISGLYCTRLQMHTSRFHERYVELGLTGWTLGVYVHGKSIGLMSGFSCIENGTKRVEETIFTGNQVFCREGETLRLQFQYDIPEGPDNYLTDNPFVSDNDNPDDRVRISLICYY